MEGSGRSENSEDARVRRKRLSRERATLFMCAESSDSCGVQVQPAALSGMRTKPVNPRDYVMIGARANDEALRTATRSLVPRPGKLSPPLPPPSDRTRVALELRVGPFGTAPCSFPSFARPAFQLSGNSRPRER